MRQVGHNLLRIGMAAMAAACSIVILLALFNWSMTERFYIDSSWVVVLQMSAVVLAFSLLASLMTRVTLSLLQRYRPASRWVAALSGGMIFLFLSLIVLYRLWWLGLLALAGGLIAGLFLYPMEPRRISRPAICFLAVAFLAWLSLLIVPALEAYEDSRAEAQSKGHTLFEYGIAGGAALGSELWLFDDSGKVISFRNADWQPTLRISSGAMALGADGSKMWALVAPRFDWRIREQPPGQFKVSSYRSGVWHSFPPVRYPADGRPLAFTFGSRPVIVVGPEKLYLIDKDSGAVQTRALSQPIERQGQFVASLIDDRTLFVGSNRGEWGGDLLRIELATGKVVRIVAQPKDDIGPITGLVPDTQKPGCIFASVGLAHMLWYGRILRVCGDHVETIFDAEILPLGKRVERIVSNRAKQFPPETEPFFALIPSPRGFLGITPRAVYRWDSGKVDRQSLPDLQRVNGLAVSRAIPGLVVVASYANASMSLSGATPLLFAVNRTDDSTK